jgi:hypothetical protein
MNQIRIQVGIGIGFWQATKKFDPGAFLAISTAGRNNDIRTQSVV